MKSNSYRVLLCLPMMLAACGGSDDSTNGSGGADLSGLGLALPSEAGYRWQVLGVGGFTDTDSTAGKHGVFDAAEYNLSRRKRVSVWRNYGISEVRKFTTAK